MWERWRLWQEREKNMDFPTKSMHDNAMHSQQQFLSCPYILFVHEETLAANKCKPEEEEESCNNFLSLPGVSAPLLTAITAWVEDQQ